MLIDPASMAVLVNSDFLQKMCMGRLTGYLFMEGRVSHRSVCTAWLANAARSSSLVPRLFFRYRVLRRAVAQWLRDWLLLQRT